MLFPIIVVIAMSFATGSVATVQNPELHNFTKNAIEGGYHGEKAKK